MAAHNRKLKQITFDLGGVEYQCQISTWQMVNNSEDGEKRHTFCPDGEFREETDPDWSLELTFYADWRSGGISEFLTLQDDQEVAFQLDHHPDIPAEHVRWNGTVKIKAPSVGGEVRTTETTEVTLACVGKPVFSRP